MRTCFLDRDGVINRDHGYVGCRERFELFPQTIKMLKLLSERKYRLILVTNQSGIARGFYSLSDFYDLSFYLLDILEKNKIDMEVRFCPHRPRDYCNCRKPKTGMIQNEYIGNSDIFIGDNETDMIVAHRMNIPNRLLVGGKQSVYASKEFIDHNSLLHYLSMMPEDQEIQQT